MKGKTKKSGFLTALPFLLPALIGFIGFKIIPIITSAFLSFTNWDGLNEMTLFSKPLEFMKQFGVGIENFKVILSSDEFWNSLFNTAYYIILYIPLVIIASLGVASILNRKHRGVGIYRVLYYIPVLTSWVAGALIWKIVLSPQYGIMNEMLGLVGIPGPDWLQSEIFAMPAIVLASVWKDMGYFGLIFLGGMQGISPTYYEAASIDGASKRAKFLKITLPLISPMTFYVLIMGIINSFQLFTPAVIMSKNSAGISGGPNGATEVLVERIYTHAFKYQEMGYASAFSWILFAFILVFTFVQMKLQKRWVNYDS